MNKPKFKKGDRAISDLMLEAKVKANQLSKMLEQKIINPRKGMELAIEIADRLSLASKIIDSQINDE